MSMPDARDIVRGSSRPDPEAPRRDVQDSESPWRKDAYAVVIGINEYIDPKIPNLRFARADAEAVHRVLTDPAIGRFNPDHVTLLLDAQATERNIKSALGTQLPRRAGRDATVVIYFAGHGAPVIDPRARSADGLEKYIIPHDAIADDLRSSGISMDSVQQYFSWLDASQVVCFLDSCYSGTAGGRSFDHPAYQTRAMLSDEFLESLASEGRFVVTACATNEVSLESPQRGHGIFTHYLVEGLRGAADTDQNGKVTIDELYEYVYRNVERDAREIGGSMNPVKKGSVRGTVYLTEYETPAARRAREALRSASEAWARGDGAAATTFWKEVLSLDPGNAEAARGIADASEAERQRASALKRKQKVLLGYANAGALAMREYNRALSLLDADPASLGDEDRQRRRLVDSLLAGELTIRSYVRSVELLDTPHTDEHAPPEQPVVMPPVAHPAVARPPAAESQGPTVPPVVAPPPVSGVSDTGSRTRTASEPEPPHTPPGAGAGRMRTRPLVLTAVGGLVAVAAVALIVANRPDPALTPDSASAEQTDSPAPLAGDVAAQPPDTTLAIVRDSAAGFANAGGNAASQPTPTPMQPRSSRDPSRIATVPSSMPTSNAAVAPLRAPPLQLASHEPANDARDVPTTATVRLTFGGLESGDRVDLATVTPERVSILMGGARRVDYTVEGDGATVILRPTSPLQEFNSTYTVAVRAGIATARGRTLGTPLTFGFSTYFWDPGYYYRLTNEARGPGEALAADDRCSLATVGRAPSQEWFFEIVDPNDGYSLMRAAAKEATHVLEGAAPPDPCELQQKGREVFSGMAWKAVPAPRPGRFYLRNANFRDSRSLALTLVDGTPTAMMQETSTAPEQFWIFTRGRRR